MKKNDAFELYKPTRQSYAAILIITYQLYKVIFRQLLPVIIIVLIQGKFAGSSWFIYSIIAVASIGAFYSILAFFKYYFYLKNQKLVVHKGVLNKSTLEIPFDRIQSINFEQNIIHRIFNVVKLNIDTAGSAGNEIQLYALQKDLANQLSEIILSNRHGDKAHNVSTEHVEDSKKIIFHLNIARLLKVGITENHIRSGGVILFFVFYVYDSLEEVGIDLIEKSEAYAPFAKQLAQSLFLVTLFIVFFAIISFIISLVRTVLTYYDLKMYRKGNGFVVVSGLLNKKEKAAKDEKVQIVKSSQNLLQKATGIYELIIRQASSVQLSDYKSIKVVGLSNHEVQETYKYILKDSFLDMNTLDYHVVNKYYWIRRLYYSGYLFLPLLVLNGILGRIDLFIFCGLFLFLAVSGSLLAFKKLRYGYNKNIVVVNGGVFGKSQQVVKTYKIQNLIIKSSYFQRRRQLCTLLIQTASGAIRIPDVKISEAESMRNYLLAIVESSKKRWM